MKSKQVLDVHQMQHLQELGMDTSNASMYWISYNGISVSIPSNFHLPTSDNDYVICDAYTLQDVLDALPESILKNDIQYWLSICRVSISIWMISYSDDVDLTTNLHHEEYESLIDAAYSMLCWAIENKFVETNKNE